MMIHGLANFKFPVFVLTFFVRISKYIKKISRRYKIL